MLARIVLAVVVGVVTFLGCLLVGLLLNALEVSFAVAIGGFLTQWAGVFGLLAALWHFFSGSTWLSSRFTRSG